MWYEDIDEVVSLDSFCVENAVVFRRLLLGPLRRGRSSSVVVPLRHILLSEMESLLITGVRIDGVVHECSKVLNLKEDVLDVIGNVRQIILKGKLSKPVVVKLNYQGPGIITAQDISLPKGVEVVRSDSMCYPYIATATSNQAFAMELLIQPSTLLVGGRIRCSSAGFMETGVSCVPVTRVNFFVESAVSDQVFEDFETLILEVSTNGSIDPIDAVRIALKKLKKRVLNFPPAFAYYGASYGEKLLYVNDWKKLYEPKKEQSSIDTLQLSVRLANCLRKHGIESISELSTYSREKLLALKGLGKVAVDQISEKLEQHYGKHLKKD